MHQKMQASSCLFYAFHVSIHFLHHKFSKLLFLLERGTHFCKTTSSDVNPKFDFFDPQTESIRVFFAASFALFALLAVPIAICSLHAFFKVLLLAAVPCIFRHQSPVSETECMHHNGNFVNFVYDLPFSLCTPCFQHLFLQIMCLFLKKCSPPSVGSMILKAAQRQIHEKCAS